jgi:hypothetical protein
MKIGLVLFFTLCISIYTEKKCEGCANYFEVIDPITFKIQTKDIKDSRLDIIYNCERGPKGRRGIKFKQKLITVRLSCLSIKNISAENYQRGKIFLREYIAKAVSTSHFFHILKFNRGPDKNGVYLFDWYNNTHKYVYYTNSDGILPEEFHSLPEALVTRAYAERFETCFSCAPIPIQGKIPISVIPFLKYYDKRKSYYSNNPNDACSLGHLNGEHRAWDYTKKLCGDHVPIASDENYDWMIPKGMFKRGVFGED